MGRTEIKGILNMRLFVGLLVLGIAVAVTMTRAPASKAATEVVAETVATPQVENVIPIVDQPVTAVMFYSNWCAACQILDPKIEAAKPQFSERPVDFVKFNFSYALVQGAKLQALADEKNLSHLYAVNKGKTGFMLLVDPATEQIIDIITLRDGVDDIEQKLDRSLLRVQVGAS